MGSERLDKVLSTALNLTRSQVRRLIKIGAVCIGGKVIKDAGAAVDGEKDKITVNGAPLLYNKFVYIMLNKPKGVISASKGNSLPTVVDILPQNMKRKNLFPAGRLDKDTTGFVLITDDGAFAHSVLSPKRHVAKTYIALLDKGVSDEIISAFEAGVIMADGTVFERAELKILDNAQNKVEVIIHEGKYHQIKRMFLRFGITVTELHREKIGNLALDADLQPGECRYITDNELEQICI